MPSPFRIFEREGGFGPRQAVTLPDLRDGRRGMPIRVRREGDCDRTANHEESGRLGAQRHDQQRDRRSIHRARQR